MFLKKVRLFMNNKKSQIEQLFMDGRSTTLCNGFTIKKIISKH